MNRLNVLGFGFVLFALALIATCPYVPVRAGDAKSQEDDGKLEVFGICEYGRRPSQSELRKLFPFFPEP